MAKAKTEPKSSRKSAKRSRTVSASSEAQKRVPAWRDLPDGEKRRVAAGMIRTYVGLTKFAAFGKGKYSIVGDASQRRLREQPTIEFGGEDDALTASLRNQFINMGRNAVRNNETLCAILEQFKLNAIGIEGGKAYFDFPAGYEDGARKLRRAFAHWCSACEFFDDMNWRDVLTIVLQTVLICGECAIVFDEGKIEDSGRVLVFEPDSILNMDPVTFKRRYPDYTQVKGKIRTKSGVIVGFFASSSERGRTYASDPAHLLAFTKRPHQHPLDVDWILLGPRWRSNQGSSTPVVSAPLASLLDTADLLGFEKESAKKNSQMYAQLIQTGPDTSDDDGLGDPSLSGDGDDDGDDGETVEDSARRAVSEQDIQPETVSFDELERCGAFYDIMPENAKLEMLSTTHPNPNVNEFIRLVECRGGWSMGLCACFVTGKVDSSFSGFRGEQLMSWPVFLKWQKFLERACDWLFRAWWRYFVEDLKEVTFDEGELPEDFMDRIRWFWPKMKEVNPVDMQNSYNLGLKNGTMGVDEIIGPDWREKLREHAEQKKLYDELGLIHPASETVSGQVVQANGETNTQEKK